MISQLLRCSGFASLNRHDQANGTLITRPSTRWKVICSSVTETPLTRGSALTAVLIPRLLNLCQFCHDDGTDLVQLTSRKCVILRQRDGLQPKLAHHSFPTNMHMHWLVAVETVEVKPIGSGNILDGGHA